MYTCDVERQGVPIPYNNMEREREIKAFAEVNPHRNDNHNNKTVQRFESWKKKVEGKKKEMEKEKKIPFNPNPKQYRRQSNMITNPLMLVAE